MIEVGVPNRLANSGSRGLKELKGLISNVNYLITIVSHLRVGAEFLRLLWGLLVVVNDSTTTFLECKGP